jgi:hypothetical protein
MPTILTLDELELTTGGVAPDRAGFTAANGRAMTLEEQACVTGAFAAGRQWGNSSGRDWHRVQLGAGDSRPFTLTDLRSFAAEGCNSAVEEATGRKNFLDSNQTGFWALPVQ